MDLLDVHGDKYNWEDSYENPIRIEFIGFFNFLKRSLVMPVPPKLLAKSLANFVSAMEDTCCFLMKP